MRAILLLLLVSAIAVLSGPAPDAFAQDKGTLDPKPLPPLANPNDPTLAAKQLFGRKALPAAGDRVIGFYAKGCIAGAEALPINGDTWQVMRLSRNRNWAHPPWWRCWSGCRPRRTRMPAGRGFWSATCRSRAAAR